jgi:hypothetical protein
MFRLEKIVYDGFWPRAVADSLTEFSPLKIKFLRKNRLNAKKFMTLQRDQGCRQLHFINYFDFISNFNFI